MPAPLAFAPLAWTALRLGAVAAVAIYAARNGGPLKHAHNEAALDGLPEGLRAEPHKTDEEHGVHGSGRFRRVFRLGSTGPGLEIDAAALGRLRLRRVG
jgi:hypothetical protein